MHIDSFWRLFAMSLYQPSAGLKSLRSLVLTAFAIAVIRFLVKPIEDKSLYSGCTKKNKEFFCQTNIKPCATAHHTGVNSVCVSSRLARTEDVNYTLTKRTRYTGDIKQSLHPIVLVINYSL